MKKIVRQLRKLLKRYVVIEHEIKIYDNEETEGYKVYIESNKRIFPYNWSNEFKTLKELDKHLSEKIEGYKRIYKD